MGWAACLGEHASTPQSGVEAPRQSKTEPPQIVLLLLFGTLLNACVCTLRTTRTCKLAASCYPCRPGDVGLRSPGFNLPRSWDEQDCPPNHADCNVTSCSQQLKHQNTWKNATSSKHVDEHAQTNSRGVLGVFCLVEFLSYQDHNH